MADSFDVMCATLPCSVPLPLSVQHYIAMCHYFAVCHTNLQCVPMNSLVIFREWSHGEQFLA